MAIAYILIKTITGKERELYYKFFYLPEVCEAHPLLGEYSLILKIKADTQEALGYIATDKIAKVDNIISLLYLPALDSLSPHPRFEEPLKNVG